MKVLCYLLAVSCVVAGQPLMRQHTYILPTEPATEEVSHCPQGRNNTTITRCLTLSELIINSTVGESVFETTELVTFGSGLHVVNGTGRRNITVSGASGLTLRGESDNNVIIECREKFWFEFRGTKNVSISNIAFVNCTGKSSVNYTLVFNKQLGSLVLDNVEISTEHGSGIDTEMTGCTNYPDKCHISINITNSKLSTNKIAFNVRFGDFFRFGTPIDIVISNTTIIKSALQVTSYYGIVGRQYYNTLTLKNMSFEGSPQWSVLILKGTAIMRTIASLQNVRMRNNRSPYLVHANSSTIHMTGINTFQNNEGVVYLIHSSLDFTHANVSFLNNTILLSYSRSVSKTVITSHGAPLLAIDSRVTFENSHVTFERNSGIHCGGITAKSNSLIIFRENSTVNFTQNYGEKGGGLSFHERSAIRFTSTNNTLVNFQNNVARRGGAIYVEDRSYMNMLERRLMSSVFGRIDDSHDNVKLKFSKNFAQIGGSDIYGGWIDWFVAEDGAVGYNENITKILDSTTSISIASDPTRVCLCSNGAINCNTTEYAMEIFGHTFAISIVAVGQRFTQVIEFVEASLKDKVFSLDNERKIVDNQKLQIVQKSCTTLQYSILQPNTEETVTISQLRTDYSPRFDSKQLQQHPDYDILFQQLSIKLTIKQCPKGFKLDDENHGCVCRSSVTSHGLRCDSNDYKILRSERQWVNITYAHTNANEVPGLIAHQHCPFDYCRVDSQSLSIRLEDPDQQCAFNRTGILCGRCREGLSRVVGSSNCMKCSNYTAIILTPVFLLSGLLLVLFLMLLNLTVSVGTINGLTFYANVIRAQHSAFFPPEASQSFMSMFIAWLNLDQGVESCLYDGFDTYTSSWLQFLFPLYIWLIAAVIIVTSHYSTRISRLTGKNAVPVLATLFLISYTKVLRFSIDALSFTTITYPDGYVRRVWLVDGNVEFFKGKHILLLLVIVFFILLSLPYTFILLTVQLLYKVSHYRFMFWVQRLKPFFDAYTGPYKASHRYWTGLLLVARIVLLVTFSANVENNLSVNLTAIITVSSLLLGWMSAVNWIYESRINNFLEAFFLTNIIVTSAAVSFNLTNNRAESPVAIYLSTSVTLILFTGIILYHVHRQLSVTRVGSKVKAKLLMAIFKREYDFGVGVQGDIEGEEKRSRSESMIMTESNRQRGVTSTVMASFENLYKAYNASELKEPLIED